MTDSTNHILAAHHYVKKMHKSTDLISMLSILQSQVVKVNMVIDGLRINVEEVIGNDYNQRLKLAFLDAREGNRDIYAMVSQIDDRLTATLDYNARAEDIRCGLLYAKYENRDNYTNDVLKTIIQKALDKVLEENMVKLCINYVMLVRIAELDRKEQKRLEKVAAKNKVKSPESDEQGYLLFDDKLNILLVKSLAEMIMEKHTFKTIGESKRVFVYKDGVYVINGEDIIVDEVQAALGERNRKAHYNEVLFYIMNATRVSIDDFNKVEDRCRYINVRNGIIEVETGKLLPHSPTYLTTIQINANYDPQATCPNFINFISGVVSKDTKEEDMTTLIEGLALCCLPVNVRRALLLIGVHANNGKTTFIELIDEFVGKENISNVSPTAMQNEPYATASMYGKAVNKDDDIPSDMLEGTETFKKATTHGVIRAREIYGKPFDFKCTLFNVFATNKPPAVPTDDNNRAFFRRWQIVDFPVRFYKADEYPEQKDLPREDPTLPMKMRTESEKSGILNLIIGAARNLNAKRDFTYGQSSEDVKELYMAKSNPVFAFIEKYVEFKDNLTEPIYITKADLHTAFMAFVEKVDVGIKWDQSRLTRQLNKDKQHDFIERSHVVTAGAIRFNPCFRGVTLNQRFKDDFETVEIIYYTKEGTIHEKSLLEGVNPNTMAWGGMMGPIKFKKAQQPEKVT